jgi:hypothetical protein
MLAIGVYVLNVGYGFEGTFTRLREIQFVGRSLGGLQPKTAVPARRDRTVSRSRGSAQCRRRCRETICWASTTRSAITRSASARTCAASGVTATGGTTYLYALAIKVPLGSWLLAVFALSLTLSQLFRRPSTPNATQWRWRDELVLLGPLAAILTIVSSQTGLNRHMRYVLPIFPFAYVWTSQIAVVFTGNRIVVQLDGGRTRVKQQGVPAGLHRAGRGHRFVLSSVFREFGFRCPRVPWRQGGPCWSSAPAPKYA